jgi:Holliday junction resolvasome RuvABC endonuclease subunit
MGVRAYLGIDPSPTKTGLALIIDDDGLLDTRIGLVVPKGLTGTPRIKYTRDAVREFVVDFSDLSAAVEGPALYSVNQPDKLGQLRGALLLFLDDLPAPTLTVSPSTVKKFATGNGGASKEKMITAAEDLWNRKMTDDEADAAWLSFIAYAHYSPEPLHALTRGQLESLRGISSPKARRATVRTYRSNNI